MGGARALLARALPRRRGPGRARASYLPFGYGPRTCIGNHMATAEIVLATAAILRRFTVERVQHAPVAAEFLHDVTTPRGIRVADVASSRQRQRDMIQNIDTIDLGQLLVRAMADRGGPASKTRGLPTAPSTSMSPGPLPSARDRESDAPRAAANCRNNVNLPPSAPGML
ncbi:cytochrome P450 [Nannocystis pusilla]|uniref:Cytochrome P450 n=1 Tax=Nannocystis pusilla TaxID=889268 RepID=A0A9X3F943_9BACT|nr:cytochrome P450 [Nannocystis pusilla]